MLSTTARTGDLNELMRSHQEKVSSSIRVASPGIIQSFDPASQSCTVQLAIRERVKNDDGTTSDTPVPILLDVPVVFPRTAKFALTLPVEAGDECLVVFADSCINAWYSSGGVQNQEERRRHDLSDGFAVIGVGSIPAALGEYAADAMELRGLEGKTKVSIKKDDIALSTEKTQISLSKDTITASAQGASIIVKQNEISLDAASVKVNGVEIP